MSTEQQTAHLPLRCQRRARRGPPVMLSWWAVLLFDESRSDGVVVTHCTASFSLAPPGSPTPEPAPTSAALRDCQARGDRQMRRCPWCLRIALLVSAADLAVAAEAAEVAAAECWDAGAICPPQSLCFSVVRGPHDARALSPTSPSAVMGASQSGIKWAEWIPIAATLMRGRSHRSSHRYTTFDLVCIPSTRDMTSSST